MKEINLVPEAYVLRRQVRSHLIGWSVLLAAFVSVLLLSMWRAQVRRQRARRELTRHQEFNQRAATLRTELSQLAGEKLQVRAKSRFFARILWRACRSRELAYISSCADEEMVLVRLGERKSVVEVPTGKPALGSRGRRARKPAAPKVKKTTRHLLIEGYALSNLNLARFIARLANSPYFERIDLKHSQQAKFLKARVFRFEVECALRPFGPNAGTGESSEGERVALGKKPADDAKP